MALNRSPDFKNSHPKPSAAERFGILRPPFEHSKMSSTTAQYQIQVSEPSGIGADFFFHVFLCSSVV